MSSRLARFVLAEYGLQDKAYELNIIAAQLARQAADEFSKPRTTALRSRLDGSDHQSDQRARRRHLSRAERSYYEQARGLRRMAAWTCCWWKPATTRAMSRPRCWPSNGCGASSGTHSDHGLGHHRTTGTMLAGQPADAFCASMSHADLISIGLNCATGPELMTDHIRTVNEMAPTRISCYPNAGLPNEEDKYLETPEIAGGTAREDSSSTAG